MWSTSMSALEPSSVTICPLTETSPPAISFSALRREVIPAAEMIFCRRSEGMYSKVIRKWLGIADSRGRAFLRILLMGWRLFDNYLLGAIIAAGMLRPRKWRRVVFGVTVACVVSSLYASIVGIRDYHGKKVMCVYSAGSGIWWRRSWEGMRHPILCPGFHRDCAVRSRNI